MLFSSPLLFRWTWTSQFAEGQAPTLSLVSPYPSLTLEFLLPSGRYWCSLDSWSSLRLLRIAALIRFLRDSLNVDWGMRWGRWGSCRRRISLRLRLAWNLGRECTVPSRCLQFLRARWWLSSRRTKTCWSLWLPCSISQPDWKLAPSLPGQRNARFSPDNFPFNPCPPW